MVSLNKEKFYKTTRVEIGDFCDREKSEAWIDLREPKTRLMANYQTMLTKYASENAEYLKDVSEEELNKMPEEKKLEYGGKKLIAQLQGSIDILEWLEDHFVEVFEDTNLTIDGDKSASAEEVKEIVFGSFPISSRVVNEFSKLLNRK